MIPFFSENYANPASTLHQAGRYARSAIDEARGQLSDLLNAFPAEIVFTSGASESNNLAVLGTIRAHRGSRRRVLVSSIEHKSILALERPLKREGFELDVLPVDSEGRLIVEELKTRLKDDVLLVSVQTANNEIGTLQDIPKIADLAHEAGAFFHTDATQSVGRLPVDVSSWDIDLLSLSSHKFYGPKGIGALYINGGASRYPIEPLIYGGGQEWSLRSGTHNVPGIVGMGYAAHISQWEMNAENERVSALRDYMEAELRERIKEIRFNGSVARRLPNSSSVTFIGIDSEALIAQLQKFALSNGAACQSGALEPSYVLSAIGLSRVDAYSTLRISLGRTSTLYDVKALTEEISSRVGQLKQYLK